MKIRLTYILAALLCCFVSRAQTVGYSYKPLAAEGCNMKYSVTRQDSVYYIIITPHCRQYLSAVSSYKDEHVQFGGAGITVVDLD